MRSCCSVVARLVLLGRPVVDLPVTVADPDPPPALADGDDATMGSSCSLKHPRGKVGPMRL
jgi:hypothetical protein